MCLLPFLNLTVLVLAWNLPSLWKRKAFIPPAVISRRDSLILLCCSEFKLDYRLRLLAKIIHSLIDQLLTLSRMLRTRTHTSSSAWCFSISALSGFPLAARTSFKVLSCHSKRSSCFSRCSPDVRLAAKGGVNCNGIKGTVRAGHKAFSWAEIIHLTSVKHVSTFFMSAHCYEPQRRGKVKTPRTNLVLVSDRDERQHVEHVSRRSLGFAQSCMLGRWADRNATCSMFQMEMNISSGWISICELHIWYIWYLGTYFPAPVTLLGSPISHPGNVMTQDCFGMFDLWDWIMTVWTSNPWITS